MTAYPRILWGLIALLTSPTLAQQTTVPSTRLREPTVAADVDLSKATDSAVRVLPPTGATARVREALPNQHTPLSVHQASQRIATVPIPREATSNRQFAANSEPPILDLPPTIATIPSLSTTPLVVFPTTQGRNIEAELTELMQKSRRFLYQGAIMTARDNGFVVIRRIVQQRCDELGSVTAVVSLAAAETAIRESADFQRAEIDARAMQRFIEAHETELVKQVGGQRLTPNQAVDIYLDFARQRIVESVGPSPLGAQALGVIAESYLQDRSSPAQRPRGLTCLRAAAGCCPTDANIANQLGFELLADGRLQESEAVLRTATSLNASAAPWQNLAELHRRRGELDLARQCAARALMLPAPSNFPFQVVEVSPEQFAMASPPPTNTPSPQCASPPMDARPSTRNNASQPVQGRVASQFFNNLWR